MHIYPRNPYGREETPRYRDRLGDLDTKKTLGTREANGFSPSKRDRQPAKKTNDPLRESPKKIRDAPSNTPAMPPLVSTSKHRLHNEKIK